MCAGTKNEADGDAETWRGAARLREQTGAPTLAPRQTDRIPGPAAAAQTHSTQQEKRGTRTLTTARGGSVAGKKKSGQPTRLARPDTPRTETRQRRRFRKREKSKHRRRGNQREQRREHGNEDPSHSGGDARLERRLREQTAHASRDPQEGRHEAGLFRGEDTG
jgi:hypothetical protein